MLTTKDLYDRMFEIDEELALEYQDGETDFAAQLEVEREELEGIVYNLECLHKSSLSRIEITDISWDAEKEIDLPKDIVFEIGVDNAHLLDTELLEDHLSEKYGYCINSFCVDFVE